MINYLLVAIGGAMGACARYAVYNLSAFLGFASQIATLVINIAGAFVIGTLYVVIIETGRLQPWSQQLLTIGFLGAFTTYSSYSLDALRLLEQGSVTNAVGYLLGTMVLCLLATWLGVSLTRIFIV